MGWKAPGVDAAGVSAGAWGVKPAGTPAAATQNTSSRMVKSTLQETRHADLIRPNA